MRQTYQAIANYYKRHEKAILVGVFIFLLIMNFVSVYLIRTEQPFRYVFFFDHEWNVPTYFTSLLWFGLAYRLLVNYKEWILAGVALFLGLDESFLIHDGTTDLTRNTFNGSGNQFLETLALFPFAWLFGGFFVMLGIIYIFWKRSQKIQNIWLIRGILIFFAGAVGVEIIGSFFVLLSNNSFTVGHIENFIYTLIITTEESLEIIGLMVTFYGAGRQLQEHTQKAYESSDRPRLFSPIRWSRKGS